MKKFYYGVLSTFVILAAFFFYQESSFTQLDTQCVTKNKFKRTSHTSTGVERKEGRAKYFNRLLRDPQTNEIPKDAITRDQKFANEYFVSPKLSKSANKGGFKYVEAGPIDVGGRTRALAYSFDGSYILAGGVSGGVWKSTDYGQTWEMKSSNTQPLSVTWLAQDPREGHQNIWYYSTGETNGNSASGDKAFFTGGGLFKSTDHGETWVEIQEDNAVNSTVSSKFDLCYKVVVDKNGYVFLSSLLYGIFVSKDGGASFEYSLGKDSDRFYYSDVDVDKDGNLLAFLSPQSSSNNVGDLLPGLHYSTDAGETWTHIPTDSLAANTGRGLVKIAPSNPKVAYLYSYGGATVDGVSAYEFFKIDLENKTVEPRSKYLPLASDVANLGKQSNYNMVLEVYPLNEKYVYVGGTNLFMSTNGFSSDNSLTLRHIGGYQSTTATSYKNHHADQHVIAFDPLDPKKAISGHDGGLSYTDNIALTSFTQSHTWTSLNNGYNVTQFYTFALAPNADDNRMFGGTQDNGTPFFRFDGTSTTPSTDVSSGDGAYCYFGKKGTFVSTQFGNILWMGFTEDRPDPILIYGAGQQASWKFIYPETDDDMPFVTPFVLDPNDEEVMYFLSEKEFWRNHNLAGIVNFTQDASTANWTKMRAETGDNLYTAVAVSHDDKVYTAVYRSGAAPMVEQWADAKTTATPAKQTILENATTNSYISSIAVNPGNGDEILVTVSNYNAISIWYSNDGAATFTNVGGALGVESGPSVRFAQIVDTDNGAHYLLGTSIGLFATTEINGSSTTWHQVGESTIGNVVVPFITHRTSDDKVAIATHGRGAFIGEYDPNLVVGIEDNSDTPEGFALQQNYPNPFNPTTTISYKLSDPQHVTLDIFDVNGQRVSRLVDDYKQVGEYKLVWDATNDNGAKVASGVYFYRIKAGKFVQTKKMNLLK